MQLLACQSLCSRNERPHPCTSSRFRRQRLRGATRTGRQSSLNARRNSSRRLAPRRMSCRCRRVPRALTRVQTMSQPEGSPLRRPPYREASWLLPKPLRLAAPWQQAASQLVVAGAEAARMCCCKRRLQMQGRHSEHPQATAAVRHSSSCPGRLVSLAARAAQPALSARTGTRCSACALCLHPLRRVQ